MKSPVEDPMVVLQKGYSLTIILAVLTFGAVMSSTYVIDYFVHSMAVVC